MNPERSKTPIVVVTGATGMLGRATAIDLARGGALVILVCRDRTRGMQALAEVKRAGPGQSHQLVIGDLAEPLSVQNAAAQIRKDFDGIDALIHTAAVFTHTRQENSAEHELMLATNVLARVLLTHELLSFLKRRAPSRILFASGPSPDRLAFDDLMARKKFQPFMQFRATNAANLMFTFELARRLAPIAVTANTYHPGILQSNLMRQMPAIVRWTTAPFGRRPDKASQALTRLALEGAYAQTTGQFYNLAKPISAPKNSLDREAQQRLWDEANRLLRIEWRDLEGESGAK